MGSDVLRGFDFTQQLGRIAADTASRHFHDLNRAAWIDHEGAAISQTCFFDQHIKVAADCMGWVADQGVLDFLDRLGGVEPGFVGEVGVGRNPVDFYAQLFKLGVMIGQIT